MPEVATPVTSLTISCTSGFSTASLTMPLSSGRAPVSAMPVPRMASGADMPVPPSPPRPLTWSTWTFPATWPTGAISSRMDAGIMPLWTTSTATSRMMMGRATLFSASTFKRMDSAWALPSSSRAPARAVRAVACCADASASASALVLTTSA